MYYHNTVIRETNRYFNPFKNLDTTESRSEPYQPELNNQWDSLVEITVLYDYLYKHGLLNKSTSSENQIMSIAGLGEIHGSEQDVVENVKNGNGCYKANEERKSVIKNGCPSGCLADQPQFFLADLFAEKPSHKNCG